MTDFQNNNIQDELPLITVALTCFNAADSIVKAIGSAQNQTYPNIEILVVDDGSIDRSVEVIKDMAAKDLRIRLVEHGENKGTAVARNTLVENAKGEFITFFDDDDTAMPERVEKQYKRILDYEHKTGAELVYCYCDRNVVKVNSNKIDHVGYGIGRKSPEPSGALVADFILWRISGQRKYGIGQMGSGTMMMRRSCFEKTGLFNPLFRRSAEVELAVRGALAGAHFISVPEPLIIQNKTLTSDKSNRKPLDYALLLRKTHKDYLAPKGLYNAARALAHAQFLGNKGDKGKARFFMLLACLLSPNIVLIDRWKYKKGDV